MGPAAKAALPALLQALETGPHDHDTGDGAIPVRSSVIEALGRSKDARAVEPLGRVLAEPRYLFAALRALGDLGPIAQPQSAALASRLEARIADTAGRAEACAEAVRQLDDRLALAVLADQKRRAHPEETMIRSTPAEHEAARRALDRGSATYARDREAACRDLVGAAAVEALAAMGCADCLTQIVEALRAPSMAQQAAWQLGRQASLPPGAEPALQAVIESDRHGPLAKDEARRVLAATTVDDARDVYAAIRLAAPGGLGTVDDQDIADEPTQTLLDVMRLAAGRSGAEHARNHPGNELGCNDANISQQRTAKPS
jgi:HEAT repeat protein